MCVSGRSKPVCGPPRKGAVVIAEVYPSLWAVSPADGEPKDAAQVRSVARFFAESDRAGELAALFAGDPSLTPEQRHRVETEEAWTLGVTAARQRPIAVPPTAHSPSPHPNPPPLAGEGRGRRVAPSPAMRERVPSAARRVRAAVHDHTPTSAIRRRSRGARLR